MNDGRNEGKTLNIRKLTRKYGLKITEDKDLLRIENNFSWSNSTSFIFTIGLSITAILALLYHCLTIEQPSPPESIGKILLPLSLLIPIYLIIDRLNYFVSIDASEIKIYRAIGIRTIPYNEKYTIKVRTENYESSEKYKPNTYQDVRVALKTENAEIVLFQFSDEEENAHEIRQLAKQLAGVMNRKMLGFNQNIQTN